jgi:hypothetical protein
MEENRHHICLDKLRKTKKYLSEIEGQGPGFEWGTQSAANSGAAASSGNYSNSSSSEVQLLM